MNILFVVPYAPSAIRTRSLNAIRALVLNGHDLTVAALWSTDEEHEALQALKGQVGSIIEKRLPTWRSGLNCLRALSGTDPLQAHYCWDPDFAERLIHEVRTRPFHVIHVEHLRGVRYAVAIQDNISSMETPRPPVVWDSVDCISALFRSAARESASPLFRWAASFEAPRTEKYEGECVGSFKRVMVVAERDRTQLVELADRSRRRQRNKGSLYERITVVPNAVDEEYFSPTAETREPLTLVITGKMSYHANVTAVVRFVEDVMPLVWTELPGVRLWIVGKDPSPQILRLGVQSSDARWPVESSVEGRARVRITGTVADIRPFVRTATIAVAPIRYGAGIQNKVLEALACGTPVVATAEAVSALNVDHGVDVLVATRPRELAANIVSLLQDPSRRARLGEAGRAFVLRRHSRRSMATALERVYAKART